MSDLDDAAGTPTPASPESPVSPESPGPPLPRVAHRRERLVGPDVTRALALVGVVIMNYHGYLNGIDAAAGSDATLPQRWFDPWTGVLSTRFAATFVLVAGVGVTLLTQRSRTSVGAAAGSGAARGDRAAIRDDRWRLIRRGVLLSAGGFVLDWIWPGTILFFYGAFFIVAALLFTLRTRWLVVVGAVSYFRLGVDRFPSVDLPTVNVRTSLPGASPAEVEAQVSQPIEEAINTVEGIKELRSVSGMGSSFVIVTFELGRDIESAAQDVRDRVASVLRDLPRDVDPPIVSKRSFVTCIAADWCPGCFANFNTAAFSRPMPLSRTVQVKNAPSISKCIAICPGVWSGAIPCTTAFSTNGCNNIGGMSIFSISVAQLFVME